MNSLNFITKDQEVKLLDKDQPDIIIDLIIFLYNIIGESSEEFSGNKLIQNLFENIYKKYSVDSISKLYTSY